MRRIFLSLILVLSLLSCGKRVGPPKKAGVKAPQAEPAVSLAQARLAPTPKDLPRATGQGRGYPRFPDYHSGMVVFTAEGDLWQVPVAGGLARRLTSHEGGEFFAKFSPDGKWLAFTGEYDGNQDVFVMPAAGGAPRRLTFHPMPDHVIGWTPDGRILFRSVRDHPLFAWTPYTIAKEGGDPRRVPLARAAEITFEPGGKRVAINRWTRDNRSWKRYAGGRATQIYIGDLSGGRFRQITTFKGMNAHPMWHGGRIYFLSNRTGTQNLWSMTPAGTDLKQHTKFDDYDVRFPSLGQGKIVFQHRAELYVFDPATGEHHQIPLRIISDALQTRVRFTDPAKYLTRFTSSPDGHYVAVEIRGDLHRLPAAREGRRIRLSSTSSTRERGLSFSPNGKEIATISDASGESEVWVYDAAGVRAPRRVTTGGTRFKYPPRWSPDGGWIAFADSDNRLYVVPAAGGAVRQVDRSPLNPITHYRWSPDGRWLAYEKVEWNYYSSIFLHRVGTNQIIRVTNSDYEDWAPAWSADGKYLAFLSSRTVNPYLGGFAFETILDKDTKPYLVLLSSKTRSPFLPRDPKKAKGRKAKAKGKDKGAAAAGKKTVKVVVETAGIQERIIEVPVPAGHVRRLYAGKGFLTYLSFPSWGLADRGGFGRRKERTGKILRFDLAKYERAKHPKPVPLFKGVVDYAVSRNGKRLVVRMPKARLFALKLGPKPISPKALKKAGIPLRKIREEVDPLAEWRQIFDEAWRMMRDFYWTPTMAGVDWVAMRNKYRPLLPRIATRGELDDLLRELVGELSVGHTYIFGGDRRRAKRVPVGTLGADIVPHPSGYYQFKKIYAGPTWDPRRRSPLAQPHVRVKEGDFLLRIDGRRVRAGENVYRYLQKAAGELVALTVNSAPSLQGTRTVEVRTLRSEFRARYYEWVKHNREYVARRTNGRVGYIHIPDMGTRGMIEFFRWFYPQWRKEGLVVDVRFNGGGFLSGVMVRRLARKILSWRFNRTGWVGPYPARSPLGRFVVLTNDRAGSDGDIFCRAIQVAKAAPVIGTRTWGGVIGISGQNPLVDRGLSTRPRSFAWWDEKIRYGVEGHGVDPDIVVDNDPAALFRGKDDQLDKAIEVVLAVMKTQPKYPPDFGPLPNKSKKAWVERYGQTDKP